MNINLTRDPVGKSFRQYLLPALSGMLIKSLFIMGDAWFIGQGVGASGLGAISLTIPAFSFFTALSMMIGIGGAALMSIEYGKGNFKVGQTLFNQSMLITTLLAAFFVTIFLLNLEDIITLMGANGEMAQQAYDYLSIMLQFYVLYALSWVMSCFIRNDANPNLAMYAMSSGAVVNLFLDYVFVIKLGWGMKGAAYATAVSQLVIAIILLTHFIRAKGRLTLNLNGFGFHYASRIMKIGTPIFFIEITSAMTIILFNYVLLSQYGESHIIAYGLTANIGVFALFTMVGITQACQPIISFNHGAQNSKKVTAIVNLGLYTSIGSGIVFLIIIWGTSEQIALLYLGASSDLIELSSNVLVFYFLSVPFMAFNLVVANLFQAIAKPAQATVISIGRGFVFVVLGVLILPSFWPSNGIWLSIIFAELMAAIISIICLKSFIEKQRCAPVSIRQQ